jgi:hypothetical protein
VQVNNLTVKTKLVGLECQIAAELPLWEVELSPNGPRMPPAPSRPTQQPTQQRASEASTVRRSRLFFDSLRPRSAGHRLVLGAACVVLFSLPAVLVSRGFTVAGDRQKVTEPALALLRRARCLRLSPPRHVWQESASDIAKVKPNAVQHGGPQRSSD